MIYGLGGDPKCPEGSEKIDDETFCKQVAKTLELDSWKAPGLRSPKLQKGCILHLGSVVFNNHPTGRETVGTGAYSVPRLVCLTGTQTND